jgi:protein involved in polysaccharide export with SLBB domain
MFNKSASSRRVSLPLLLTVIAAFVLTASSQTGGRNNPYSPNPAGKQSAREAPALPANQQNEPAVEIIPANAIVSDRRSTIARRTNPTARQAELNSKPLTEVYKVGVGDVLAIALKSASQGSGYYTVRADGTIDFPLAGEKVIVAGQRVDAIREILESGITLFPDPQVEVSVREYISHKIGVSGLISDPGEKGLQREAVPLFVIRAEAVVDPKATRVLISRESSNPEIYDLKDAATDNVLIYPGNSLEFVGDDQKAGFFYLSGEVTSAGQKPLSPGMTLDQALIASGGAKGDPKKAIIRRKTAKGVFAVSEHNLRSIHDGKAIDPVLATGDIVEIKD